MERDRELVGHVDGDPMAVLSHPSEWAQVESGLNGLDELLPCLGSSAQVEVELYSRLC